MQRKTVDVEKKAVQAARANNYKIAKPPGSYNSQNSNKSIFENNFVDNKGPTQMQMQEDVDLQALEEQERTIRELEVSFSSSKLVCEWNKNFENFFVGKHRRRQ